MKIKFPITVYFFFLALSTIQSNACGDEKNISISRIVASGWFGTVRNENDQEISLLSTDPLVEKIEKNLSEKIKGTISMPLEGNRATHYTRDSSDGKFWIVLNSNPANRSLQVNFFSFLSMLFFIEESEEIDLIRTEFESSKTNIDQTLLSLLKNEHQRLIEMKKFGSNDWKRWCDQNNVRFDAQFWNQNSSEEFDVWARTEGAARRKTWENVISKEWRKGTKTRNQ